MEDEARALLDRSGGVATGEELAWEVDMRYRGQAYNLTVPLPPRPTGAAGLAAAEAAFAAEHHRLYDYTPPVAETEIVTIRLRATARTRPARSEGGAPVDAPAGTQRVYDGAWADWPVVARDALAPGTPLAGPAIIEQEDATTVLHRDWTAAVQPGGALVLERA